MKLSNIASLDSVITLTGRKGLTNVSVADKAMWEEMQSSWDLFVLEIEKAEHSFGVSSEVNNEIDDNLGLPQS